MIWIQAGFATVGYSATLKGVDVSMLEAARIDSATDNQMFFRIIIPNIIIPNMMGTIVVVLTTTVIATLKVCDIAKAMTGGNVETSVVAKQMYNQRCTQRNPFLAATFAVILSSPSSRSSS
jgi:alpha-glucoside transport system permease protein